MTLPVKDDDAWAVGRAIDPTRCGNQQSAPESVGDRRGQRHKAVHLILGEPSPVGIPEQPRSGPVRAADYERDSQLVSNSVVLVGSMPGAAGGIAVGCEAGGSGDTAAAGEEPPFVYVPYSWDGPGEVPLSSGISSAGAVAQDRLRIARLGRAHDHDPRMSAPTPQRSWTQSPVESGSSAGCLHRLSSRRATSHRAVREKGVEMTQAVSGGVETLQAAMAGPVVVPGDFDYDERRRVWNADIDRRPAVIARCFSAKDVAAAIRFGREQGLDITVRGGAHSMRGTSVYDDGLMIDLSLLNKVSVTPEARRVQVGGGALLADRDTATLAHGLAAPLALSATPESVGSPSVAAWLVDTQARIKHRQPCGC
jgi:hypothetical protein